MKHHTQWMALAIAAVGGLATAGSSQAQAVTGDPYLDNILPAAKYGSWQTASITSTATGVQVAGLASYGSAYFAVDPSQYQTLSPNDTQATLTVTINGAAVSPGDANSGYWMGMPFILNDNAGAYTYGGYVGEFGYTGAGTALWNGNTVSMTETLDPAQIAAIQAGNDTIYGFNLQLDPAVFPSGFENVTFNSLTLSGAVPEPSTLALLCSGAAGLWSMRRRSK